MHRICYFAGLLLVVFGGVLAFATVAPSDINGKRIEMKNMEPFFTFTRDFTFVGKNRAVVVCVGSPESSLGVYVYDAHGNCVAWDDVVASRPQPHADKLPNGMAVEWVPADTSSYTVEVVNLGGAGIEKCEFVAK